jgi:hypothetical protein
MAYGDNAKKLRFESCSDGSMLNRVQSSLLFTEYPISFLPCILLFSCVIFLNICTCYAPKFSPLTISFILRVDTCCSTLTSVQCCSNPQSPPSPPPPLLLYSPDSVDSVIIRIAHKRWAVVFIFAPQPGSATFVFTYEGGCNLSLYRRY